MGFPPTHAPPPVSPSSFEEAAGALASAAAAGQSVRVIGAGTKLGWGLAVDEPDVVIRTGALDSVVEHNVGDLTAVLEAGVPLARAQERFAAAGQMLALDPPLGVGERRDATIGGVIATGDCGPLRHRYGAPRDLVLGMTVALSDGTIARSGGKVIKNVAGYDIGKLFAGSFGTLGMILSVAVRLHPLPVHSVSALGASSDPAALSRAAQALSRAPLELEVLDVAWRGGRGGLLARLGGAEASRRAARVASLMGDAGLEDVDVVAEDDGLWARQRAGQRASSSSDGALVRVAARPSALEGVLRAAEESGGTLVGRATLGTSYVELSPGDVGSLRRRLPAGAVCVLHDAPASLRSDPDAVWGAASSSGPALELMRRVKARFDPAGACNRGVFVGGI
jgi:glycolate oxidase FAD binding subunit